MHLCFLTGQRLFRRSGAGSESFSETSSVGQPEEAAREENTSQSSSIPPPISPSPPEEDSHPASEAIQQTIQESPEQGDTQGEALDASQERQPECQGVEHSQR